MLEPSCQLNLSQLYKTNASYFLCPSGNASNTYIYHKYGGIGAALCIDQDIVPPSEGQPKTQYCNTITIDLL